MLNRISQCYFHPNRPLNASRRGGSWSGPGPAPRRCTCWCTAAGRGSPSRGWSSRTSTAACWSWSRTRPFTWTSWAEVGRDAAREQKSKTQSIGIYVIHCKRLMLLHLRLYFYFGDELFAPFLLDSESCFLPWAALEKCQMFTKVLKSLSAVGSVGWDGMCMESVTWRWGFRKILQLKKKCFLDLDAAAKCLCNLWVGGSCQCK